MQPRTTPSRRILIIDDNPAIHADFRKVLGPKGGNDALSTAKAALFGDSHAGIAKDARGGFPVFELESALQGELGLAAAQHAIAEGRPFSVAFVDMRMPPGWDGVETIQRLWRVDPDLQIVICSAYSDYTFDQITNTLGATDRLLILRKPFEPAEVAQLATALSEKWALARSARLKLDELEGMVEARTTELAFAARHDTLTGLGNRAYFNQQLQVAIDRHKRHSGYRFAVLFADFDRFKQVNDSLGHDAGDQLLVQIAARLRQALRPTDCMSRPCIDPAAARLGGDEFVLLIDDLREPADAARVAQRLIDILAKPYVINGNEVHSTASIGVATSEAGYDSPSDMIRDADNAMYHAKAAGKGRFVLFDHRMHEEIVARLQLENDLRVAVDRKQMLLHYQPVVNLTSGSIEGFEALIRWNHPIRGMVSPAEFVPACEDTGLIVPVGEWVLAEACRQAVRWQSMRPAGERLLMHVNVSARQLTAPNFTSLVARTIVETGIEPASLALEITETVMISSMETAAEALGALRKLGVQIYMDDFGTGYSSLSCLHRLPLTGLKIDRSFIQSCSERREYAAIVDAIVKLARNLGIELVAEGIETADQVALLLALECQLVQGYFFGRPCPAAEAEKLLHVRLPRPQAVAA